MSQPPGDLLHRTVKFFVQKGDVFKGYKLDHYGAYAAGLVTRDTHLPYLLVVKTSKLGQETVSFQREILYAWNGPIVMGLGGSREELSQEYVVFHPDIIRRVRIGENKPWINQRPESPDIDMINFSQFLGNPWNPEKEQLETVWEKLKKRNDAEARERIDVYA